MRPEVTITESAIATIAGILTLEILAQHKRPLIKRHALEAHRGARQVHDALPGEEAHSQHKGKKPRRGNHLPGSRDLEQHRTRDQATALGIVTDPLLTCRPLRRRPRR